jgi:ribonuclease HI
MTLSLPEFQPDKLTKALEQAIYSAHSHKNNQPSATILILPDWKHTPYLARNLHTNYIQKIVTLPHTHTTTRTQPRKYNLNIYLVANQKALNLIEPNTTQQTMNMALTQTYGHTINTKFIEINTQDAITIDSITAYNEIPAPAHIPHTPTILHTKPHTRKWNPIDFVYTDGSQVKGNNTLGAGVVNPKTEHIIHIEIKSQKERHTINRAELAAITTALRTENTEEDLHILTDSSFCINTIRNYTIDPASYNTHLHKDLLHLTDQLLRTREKKNLKTHIGKVKSHTDIEYNEAADKAARQVVEGEATPDITFEEADPPVGGLRTWPQIRNTTPNNPDNIKKFTNLKAGIKTAIKETTYTKTRGIFGDLLRKARETGTDFSIQAYSKSPYRSRRDSYEVAWGTHVYRCKRKHNTGPMTCTKCNQLLTNTHLLGGCKYNAKMRTSRHNSTFKLLHELLQTQNGGRWPILSVDLGKKPVKDFKAQTIIEKIDTQEDYTLQPLEASEEGLQNDKKHTKHPTIIPTNILPKHKRPKHHKPDIIRAIGYTINKEGALMADPAYRGRRCIQIIECKYSTDTNTLETIEHIHTIYEPLKQAIQLHNNGRIQVEVIPIVISRTGNFHTRTLAEIAQLVSLKENPPDTLTYKALPDQAQTIAMTLHIHAQEWLTLMSKISRTILTQRHKNRKTPTAQDDN